MFSNEAEYREFLAWAIEGSSIAQRMQSAGGDEVAIPSYWVKAKPYAEKYKASLDITLMNKLITGI